MNKTTEHGLRMKVKLCKPLIQATRTSKPVELPHEWICFLPDGYGTTNAKSIEQAREIAASFGFSGIAL